MSAPPDENNMKYGWLNKAKFEADKARKQPNPENTAPWSASAWQAAAEAFRAGVVEPERRFPIIITSSSTGPLTTPQELQQVDGLSSLPDVQWTTRTSLLDEDGEEGSKRTDGRKPERIQYCDVNYDQLVRVKEHTDGERVLVWFQGKKRVAWLAHSVKQKSGNQGARSRSGSPNKG